MDDLLFVHDINLRSPQDWRSLRVLEIFPLQQATRMPFLPRLVVTRLLVVSRVCSSLHVKSSHTQPFRLS